MDMTEMRQLARSRTGAADYETYLLDEAYYGRDALKNAEHYMDQIRVMIRNDPNMNINDTPEAKKLDAEFKKVFGFKDFRIFWTNTPRMSLTSGGGYTFPRSRMTGPRKYYGTHGKNGFYDRDHVMCVYVIICVDMFYNSAQLSTQEIMACVLHEIGHNFDYSPFSVIYDLLTIVKLIINVDPAALIMGPLMKRFNKQTTFLFTLDDQIAQALPPIGILYRFVGKVFNVVKFLYAILNSTANMVLLPAHLFFMPLSYAVNFFGRKNETFADTFAASYGYGPEMGISLDKIVLKYESGPSVLDDHPVVDFFANYNMLAQEIVADMSGNHTSNYKRMSKIITKMEADLNDPQIDKKTKAELRKELDRAEEIYKKFIGLKPEDKKVFVSAYRQVLDNWTHHRGYYIMAPITDDNFAK